jgi:hypothetical protein
MSDESIAARIERLVNEEHELRQRRALRDSGGNPDDAQVRDEGTVEGYLQ